MSGTSWISVDILSAFFVYWAIVEYLKRSGKLEKWNVSAFGPILLVRTTKGLNLLERISKPKRFWRTIATLGIPSVFVGMGFMLFLLLTMDYVMLTHPPKPSAITNPRNALLIPGINQFIPLAWGLIGLVVTIVVHEFSHAILCRVEGVRVKSMGVVLALIPIGGFAEPDEEELLDEKKIRKAQRIRIFSAGVISNFIVATVAFAIFFSLLSYLQPHVVVVQSHVPGVKNGSVVYEINGMKVYDEDDVAKALGMGKYVNISVDREKLILKKVAGVYVVGTLEGYPAENAGIRKGDAIVAVNGTPTPNLKVFMKIMESTKPNETITVTIYNGSTLRNVTMTLKKRNGHGFMGVLIGGDYLSGLVLGYSEAVLKEIKSIPSKLTDPRGWIFVVAMPFIFQGFSNNVFKYFSPTGFWKDYENLLFYLLNMFYWIGWIDFYVGLFNCLPAIPLDGGRIFQEVLTSLLKGERGREFSLLVVKLLAFIVFFSIIMSILIPNIRFI